MVVSARDWEQILSGDLFNFVCGDGRNTHRKTFQIHAGLVAQVSRPLERLMNNGAMTESIERRVHLVEVDPETFSLFTQWLYSGAYGLTDLDHPALSPPTAPNHHGGFCIRCGGIAAPRPSQLWPFCSAECCRAHRGRRFSIWRYCVQCGVPEFVNKDEIWLRCEDCGRLQTDTDTAAVSLERLPHFDGIYSSKSNVKYIDKLFEHAKLYAFAEMFMIDKLKEMCLRELQRCTEDLNVPTADWLDRAMEEISLPGWNSRNLMDDIEEAVSRVESIDGPLPTLKILEVSI